MVTAYRALQVAAGVFDTRPRIRSWEQPWVRSFEDSEGHLNYVRLPAAAVVELAPGVRESLLLLPDVGTVSVASYAHLVRRLTQLRQLTAQPSEPLLVVALLDGAISDARHTAWLDLLARTAARLGEQPIRADIVLGAIDGQGSRSARRRTTQLNLVFELLARHPLLTRAQVAGLVGTTAPRVAALENRLVERGWLRPIDPKAASTVQMTARPTEFVELTAAGTREALRRLRLTNSDAEHQLGFVGSRSRARRRMLRQVDHTIGANAFFVGLARAARTSAPRYVCQALVEWRSAAACARGRCRPDGYGCYRRGEDRFGFFLEYDRGTERAREYAAKLDAYYRYRDTGRADREYTGFPTVLFVTTAAPAETLFAHQAYLAAERHGRDLPLLLTTSRDIDQDRNGALGPIWRAPGPIGEPPPRRGYWLPPHIDEPPKLGGRNRALGSTDVAEISGRGVHALPAAFVPAQSRALYLLAQGLGRQASMQPPGRERACQPHVSVDHRHTNLPGTNVT